MRALSLAAAETAQSAAAKSSELSDATQHATTAANAARSVELKNAARAAYDRAEALAAAACDLAKDLEANKEAAYHALCEAQDRAEEMTRVAEGVITALDAADGADRPALDAALESAQAYELAPEEPAFVAALERRAALDALVGVDMCDAGALGDVLDWAERAALPAHMLAAARERKAKLDEFSAASAMCGELDKSDDDADNDHGGGDSTCGPVHCDAEGLMSFGGT